MRLIHILLACALAALALPAAAQTYPNRPIKLLVSYPPGGASDLIARLIADPLSRRLGQPVVVENRPGAAGNIAGEATAHAAPDGYTLLLGPSALFAINPHLYAHMPIDPLKELMPIASLVENELVLTANTKISADMDFKAFIEFAAKKPVMAKATLPQAQEERKPQTPAVVLPYKPSARRAVAGATPMRTARRVAVAR